MKYVNYQDFFATKIFETHPETFFETKSFETSTETFLSPKFSRPIARLFLIPKFSRLIPRLFLNQIISRLILGQLKRITKHFAHFPCPGESDPYVNFPWQEEEVEYLLKNKRAIKRHLAIWKSHHNMKSGDAMKAIKSQTVKSFGHSSGL